MSAFMLVISTLTERYTPDLWQNRQIKADHRFFRPWFDTAFQRHERGQLYDASQGLPLGDISQKHPVQANAYCMKCQKEHDFDFGIGGILKLVLDAISRDEWVHMLEEKYQVSHLNGFPMMEIRSIIS